jgi:MSHA biogenesis protein MshP
MRAGAPQHGVALVAAIFLVVVLVALGAAMAVMSSVSQDTATKSLLTAKVYYGARAGLEWGIQRAVAAASCPGGATAFTLAQGGLAGVAVQVTCVQQSVHGGTNFVYYITSNATIGALGGLDYAERRIEATVSNIP